jgi:hypothetical protein
MDAEETTFTSVTLRSADCIADDARLNRIGGLLAMRVVRRALWKRYKVSRLRSGRHAGTGRHFPGECFAFEDRAADRERLNWNDGAVVAIVALPCSPSAATAGL